MKKLAFVINVFREDGFHSGGERVFYELVNRAVDMGWVVDLYCSSYLSNQNILRPKINKIKIIGHPKDFKYPDKIEKFYDEVKNLIQEENYDHVISENISPSLYDSLVARHKRHSEEAKPLLQPLLAIRILQGHSLLHYREMSGNFPSKLLFTLQKHNFINAQKKWLKQPYSKIITPSNVLKEELIRNFGMNEENFIVIYPGVEGSKNHGEGSIFCGEGGKKCYPHESIITFGLSAPSFSKKGGNIFLKSLSVLKKKGYKFKAKIIYSKAKKNLKLQFLLYKYGLRDFIEFLPYQKDMQQFYNSVDVVVMPSLMETFGLVALEGMINAKPAIVSSFCGVSEILKDGNNGFVFDMKKKASKNLAEKLIYILENKEKYHLLSQNAYETAIHHNWQDFCDKFFGALA